MRRHLPIWMRPSLPPMAKPVGESSPSPGTCAPAPRTSGRLRRSNLGRRLEDAIHAITPRPSSPERIPSMRHAIPGGAGTAGDGGRAGGRRPRDQRLASECVVMISERWERLSLSRGEIYSKQTKGET